MRSIQRPMSALGQKRTSRRDLAMSALPLKADKAQTCWHVRFVPLANVAHETAVDRTFLPRIDDRNGVTLRERHQLLSPSAKTKAAVQQQNPCFCRGLGFMRT